VGIAATFGAVLAALYLLWSYQRIFHGPLDREENRGLRDLTRREVGVLVPLIALIVAIGLQPRPLYDLVQPSVDRVLAEVAVTVDAPPTEG
jgi:NADH-quinone oxidoreductase subunit M